ncbi:MAG: hypothetical protein KDN19_00280 [Verrucomicrobiae bacterium]|nr:hypothetical protein [Verrucomicrobiae bacterium]
MKTSAFWIAAAAAMLLIGCGEQTAEKKDPAGEQASVDFVNDVKPILQTQCVRCHHDGAIMGGLNLTTHKAAMKGSSRGPVIVPGEPDKSPLYRVTLLPEEENHAMPATGPKLTEPQKDILRRWIEQGASWPEGDDGTVPPIEAEVEKV